jgi:hypothetical protein
LADVWYIKNEKISKQKGCVDVKKISAVLLCLVLIWSLAACGQNRIGEESDHIMSDELELTLVKAPLPANKVIFQLYNPTDVPYYFGWDYEFEVLKDGAWYSTDYTGTHDVPAELLTLEPGSTLEHTFYTDDGAEFRPGTYRIVMEFWKEMQQIPHENGVFICGEFTVTY